MQPRMRNPAVIILDAMQAILALEKSAKKGYVSSTTLELVHFPVDFSHELPASDAQS